MHYWFSYFISSHLFKYPILRSLLMIYDPHCSSSINTQLIMDSIHRCLKCVDQSTVVKTKKISISKLAKKNYCLDLYLVTVISLFCICLFLLFSDFYYFILSLLIFAIFLFFYVCLWIFDIFSSFHKVYKYL